MKNYRQSNARHVAKSPRFRLSEARQMGDRTTLHSATNAKSKHGDEPGTSNEHSSKGLRGECDPRVERAQQAAQTALESLPLTVIRQARAFREYLQHFVEQGDAMGEDAQGNEVSPTIPPETLEILEEIAQAEGLGERLKSEILQDDEARNVCPTPLH